MLHTIRPAFGSTKKRKRVARGSSAGGGTTAGRGTKGQQSRTGKGRRFGFEGGQVPLLRRQPKLGGFINPRKVYYEIVKLEDLERLPAGTYTLKDLQAQRLVHAKKPVKILGGGTLTKKLSIEAHAASRSAKDAIKQAGGTITLLRD